MSDYAELCSDHRCGNCTRCINDRLRAERDDYKRAWQRDLEKGREFLADLAATRRQLEEARELLAEADEVLSAWWNSMGDGSDKGPFPGLVDDTAKLVPQLRACLAPPAATPPPAQTFEERSKDWRYDLKCAGGPCRGCEPATPPQCASWCGDRAVMEGAVVYRCLGVERWFCSPACRDAGAPRNPAKP